jgi:hypothetical protein
MSPLVRPALALSLIATAAGAQVSIGPPVRVDAGRGTAACNESSIAVSPARPLELVAAWNVYREGSPRCGTGLSMDGGATWIDALLRPPAQHQNPTEGDPMTAADPRTGALWAGGLSFGFNGGVFVARKNPGDAFFQPTVMVRVTFSPDKPWMAAGPAPGDPGSTRVYVAYNEGLSISSDMGDSWALPISLGPCGSSFNLTGAVSVLWQ